MSQDPVALPHGEQLGEQMNLEDWYKLFLDEAARKRRLPGRG
jgi:hypothetical protein